MAIRAQENAFRDFLAQLRQRPRQPSHRQSEALGLRGDVVERKRTDTPVVAAHNASATGFAN
jgi:hypothetical protein